MTGRLASLCLSTYNRKYTYIYIETFIQVHIQINSVKLYVHKSFLHTGYFLASASVPQFLPASNKLSNEATTSWQPMGHCQKTKLKKNLNLLSFGRFLSRFQTRDCVFKALYFSFTGKQWSYQTNFKTFVVKTKTVQSDNKGKSRDSHIKIKIVVLLFVMEHLVIVWLMTSHFSSLAVSFSLVSCLLVEVSKHNESKSLLLSSVCWWFQTLAACSGRLCLVPWSFIKPPYRRHHNASFITSSSRWSLICWHSPCPPLPAAPRAIHHHDSRLSPPVAILFNQDR